MFTGIIEQSGRVGDLNRDAHGARLTITTTDPLESLREGESIAVNGVCLTVEPKSTPQSLVFYLSAETLSRTTLGDIQRGATVNIERALRVGDRLGGHLVHGHVDAVGEIQLWERDQNGAGEGYVLEIAMPESLAALVAPKGSIAVDGISLTVVYAGPRSFSVAVIPHTARVTTLSAAAPGMKVNLEADMLARYVARALAAQREVTSGDGMRELLTRAGF